VQKVAPESRDKEAEKRDIICNRCAKSNSCRVEIREQLFARYRLQIMARVCRSRVADGRYENAVWPSGQIAFRPTKEDTQPSLRFVPFDAPESSPFLRSGYIVMEKPTECGLECLSSIAEMTRRFAELSATVPDCAKGVAGGVLPRRLFDV